MSYPEQSDTLQAQAAPAEPTTPPPRKTADETLLGLRWRHIELRKRILSAIQVLPNHFTSTLNIEGVLATDLFTLNTPLGAAIEQSLVDCLNDLRDVWDPLKEYSPFAFVRQAQAFPDVRLVADDAAVPEDERIILGIELKGWFTLAKEGEPSFRYKQSPDVCAPQDLLVVVPWMFSNVISGTPVLMKPIITEAKFAAEMRNYWWEFVREAKDPPNRRGLIKAGHQNPYPAKADKCNDEPISDAGGNFGRVARVGALDKEIDATLTHLAAGIPLKYWHKFLDIFKDKATQEIIEGKLAAIQSTMDSRFHLSTNQHAAIRDAFLQLAQAMAVDPAPVAVKRAKSKNAAGAAPANATPPGIDPLAGVAE